MHPQLPPHSRRRYSLRMCWPRSQNSTLVVYGASISHSVAIDISCTVAIADTTHASLAVTRPKHNFAVNCHNRWWCLDTELENITLPSRQSARPSELRP